MSKWWNHQISLSRDIGAVPVVAIISYGKPVGESAGSLTGIFQNIELDNLPLRHSDHEFSKEVLLF